MRREPVLRCEECRCVSDMRAVGWAAFLGEDPDGLEPTSVSIFCPLCAANHFANRPDPADRARERCHAFNMADHTYPDRARELFHESGLIAQLEELAQQAAGTEATLYAHSLSDDEKVLARFEIELQREIECWNVLREEIGERVARREALADAERAKRMNRFEQEL